MKNYPVLGRFAIFATVFAISMIMLFTYACREEILVSKEIEPETSNSLYSTDDLSLIDTVRSYLQTQHWEEITSTAGEPQWDCIYIRNVQDSVTKVVLPYKNSITDEIENLLIAYVSEGEWGVKLVNRYYYLLMSNTTGSEANKLFYKAILNEFSTAEGVCAGLYPTSIDDENEIVPRTVEVIAIILFGDGAMWTIYSDGSVVVNVATDNYENHGCPGWDCGSIIWNDGGYYNFAPTYNGTTFNSYNWHGFEEKAFNCGWCLTNNQGGGSNGSASPNPCQDPNSFWAGLDPMIKKDYVNTLSDLMNHFDVISCSRPNLSPSEAQMCISEADLLCLGLANNCFNVVDGHFDENGFTECFGAVLNMLPCIDYVTTFLTTHNLNMAPMEFAALTGGFYDNCTSQADFNNHIYEQLGCDEITPEFWAEHLAFRYYTQTKILANPELRDYYKGLQATFNEINCAEPEILVSQVIKLNNILESDPLFLLKDCFSTNEEYDISFWSELASFTPPQSVRNKVVQDGHSLQLINNARAAGVNLDYFRIRISNMPDINGQDMTNEELITHFRKNMSIFSNHGMFGSEFNPKPADITLWNSSNPTGTIVDINIPGDDGAVVCSDHKTCCYTFSTLKSPLWTIDDHPVSGNRQFGISEEGGNKYFYIKGADRGHNWFQSTLAPHYYGGGDALWSTTVEHFKMYIDNNGGQGIVLDAIKKRPSWDAVKAVLLENQPITTISCE
jgi:hypothetical protein